MNDGEVHTAGKPTRRDWRWLGSRWVIVPGVMTLTILIWLAYVGSHDNGLIEGQVVDATGAPVAGATVLLFERGFVTHQERARATTDSQGRFRFTDNRSHSIQLEAAAPQLGRSERRIVRLWFAAQDARLEQPLRFQAPK
jgi:hypothetical protein